MDAVAFIGRRAAPQRSGQALALTRPQASAIMGGVSPRPRRSSAARGKSMNGGGWTMTTELVAATPAGRQAVAIAERHLPALSERAEAYDRTNSYVKQNITDLYASGLLHLGVPTGLGGLGVESVFDTAVVISRLGRGCASTALAANMIIGQMLLRSWRLDRSRRFGDSETADDLEATLEAIVEGNLTMVGSATEPGGAWGIPYSTAVREGDEYVLNGQKTFVTNSEIADVITVSVRVLLDDGTWALGEASFAPGTPGFKIGSGWDALGMRGTGSQAVSFQDCRLPAGFVKVTGPLEPPPHDDLVLHCLIDFPLLGAYLGIAETAHDDAVKGSMAPLKRPFAGVGRDREAVRREIAEMELGLFAARASIERAGKLLDGYLAHTRGAEHFDDDGIHKVFAQWQCAKMLVNRSAMDIVTRAMALRGGRGYASSGLLARLYRDSRASDFMQPFSSVDGYEYIGLVATGLDPFASLKDALLADGQTS